MVRSAEPRRSLLGMVGSRRHWRAEPRPCGTMSSRCGSAAPGGHRVRSSRNSRRAVVFASVDRDETLVFAGSEAIAQFGAGDTTLVSRDRSTCVPQSSRMGAAVLSRADQPVGSDRKPPMSSLRHGGFGSGLPWRVILEKNVYRGGVSPAAPCSSSQPRFCSGPAMSIRSPDAPIDCETFLDIVTELRRSRSKSVTMSACYVGMSFWKRARVAAMLGGTRRPAFRKTARSAIAVATRRGGAIAVWPSRAPAAVGRARSCRRRSGATTRGRLRALRRDRRRVPTAALARIGRARLVLRCDATERSRGDPLRNIVLAGH